MRACKEFGVLQGDLGYFRLALGLFFMSQALKSTTTTTQLLADMYMCTHNLAKSNLHVIVKPSRKRRPS